MKQGYWIIRTYECGAIGEKTKFFVPGDPARRSAAREKTAERKAAQNEYSAIKNLTRVLNLNFCGGDLLVGLDYDDEGMRKLIAQASDGVGDFAMLDETEKMQMIFDAAKHEASLFLRRVKRELRKNGQDLYAVSVTSDMDGETGETVRVHHHIVCNAEAEAYISAKWSLGGTDKVKLKNQNDYKKLAEYLIRQVRRIPDDKKYVCTKNLERPVPKDRVAISASQMRAPKGAELLYANAYVKGEAQYIRYLLPTEKRKKAKKQLRKRRKGGNQNE